MDSLGVRATRACHASGPEASERAPAAEPGWHEHALTAGLPASALAWSTACSIRWRRRIRNSSGGEGEGAARPLATEDGDGVERLLTAEDGEREWILAAEFAFGEGRVVILSEGDPISNEWAGEHPLAVLAVRAALAYTSEADTVFFDEFHQGIRGDRTRAEVLRDFFLGNPAGRTLLHLVVVSFLILGCLGLRLGAPTPAAAPPDLERRSPLEHVSALGDLYRKAEADKTAALLLVARLARTTRHPPPRTAAEAASLLRKLDVGAGADTPLARARGGLGNDPPDLAALAAGIDEYLAARG